MSCERVLLIDLGPSSCSTGDCSLFANALQSWLKNSECVRTNSSGAEQISFSPNLIILHSHTIERLAGSMAMVRTRWRWVPVLGVLCEAWKSTAALLECFANGLDDFVECPVREQDLVVRARRLLLKACAESQPQLSESRLHLDFLVGESASFRRLLAKLPQIARSRMTVLLMGETGTGKELFARAIHYISPRKGYPFVPVNCGGLPDQLLENELFGHVRGAYTDANTGHSGLLGVAERGTLFLDEIDALSLPAQVKLLRFLQDREYRPLGSSKTLTADIRIMAATNTDLRERVLGRQFREDLFHRLNVLYLSIPPLRDRCDDIPCFVGHFLLKIAAQEMQEPKRLTSAGLRKLQSYGWPGNVRELEGVIQRAVIMSSNQIIDSGDLELPTDLEPQTQGRSLREIKNQAVGQIERAHIVSLLAAHHGNMTRASHEAGTNRRTLQRLVRKYDLERCQFVNLGVPAPQPLPDPQVSVHQIPGKISKKRIAENRQQMG